MAAGVVVAIDRSGTVRHAVRLIENFWRNESTHSIRYLGKESSENIDIYYKDWVADSRLSTEISQNDGRMFSVVECKKVIHEMSAMFRR